MTDKPTPTDAELEALLLDKLPASKHYIRPVIEKMVAAMQAAIDKWGQPAQAAEPVARLVIGRTKGGISLTHMVVPAAYQLQEGMYALYTAPRPVAREPLTPEQRTAAFIRAEKKMQSDVNLSWRHALVDEIEAEHGIKGGQHVS